MTADEANKANPGEGLDFTAATAAGIYACLLGSKDTTAADRAAAARVIRQAPDAPQVAQENLAFAGRAAAWEVRSKGIRQVIDIGVGKLAGVPITSVEDRVRQVDPAITVFAYDNDEVVLSHTRALRDYGAVLRGDVTDLDTILAHPEAVTPRKPSAPRLDVAAPMVVVMAAVLHFVPNPAAVMAGLRKRLAPGSVAVLSHATSTDRDGRSTDQDRVEGIKHAYDDAQSTITFRTEDEIRALADGWEIEDPPGLVDVGAWGLPEPHDGHLGEAVRVVGMTAVLPDGGR